MERTKKDKIFYSVVLTLLVLTLVWIFVQSSLPAEVSESESDKVTEIVDKVVPEEFSLKDFIIENIRKIAHFVEFGALGVEVFLLIWYSKRMGVKEILLGIGFGALIAFLDETVQILSDRGAAVLDVWIDIGGFSSFYLIPLAAIFAFRLVREKKIKNSISS